MVVCACEQQGGGSVSYKTRITRTALAMHCSTAPTYLQQSEPMKHVEPRGWHAPHDEAVQDAWTQYAEQQSEGRRQDAPDALHAPQVEVDRQRLPEQQSLV